MVNKISLIAMVVGLLVASSFVGAAAFTSATVERDVTVTVNNDDSGIIKLQNGTVDGADISNGKLQINAEGDALNRDAVFRYGDNSSVTTAQNKHAFKLTNADDTQHTFNIKSSISSGSSEIDYYVAANSVITAINSNGSADITLASGETAYVVIVFNTADETTDIDGSLTISV